MAKTITTEAEMLDKVQFLIDCYPGCSVSIGGLQSYPADRDGANWHVALQGLTAERHDRRLLIADEIRLLRRNYNVVHQGA